jgi:hypothetical protein
VIFLPPVKNVPVKVDTCGDITIVAPDPFGAHCCSTAEILAQQASVAFPETLEGVLDKIDLGLGTLDGILVELVTMK